ncbi:hypothetical protein HJJEPNFP_00001 [Ralstonia phage BOESR1]|uniref:Lipoprotein n=1 Tax=Ralstonia phage BOESR1 TaxID=3034917 RepID=A0AA50F2Q4_9CAUD|nr:hypothetical protein HJJEPNFP_00001 [Ralstonia phage BOESR1]WLW40580.1 hypothetical protein HIBIKMCM_00013 [Ralstonia phage BOESR1]
MLRKILGATVMALLAGCGGGEEDVQQPTQERTLRPPEHSICATTVPIPPDCVLKQK